MRTRSLLSNPGNKRLSEGDSVYLIRMSLSNGTVDGQKQEEEQGPEHSLLHVPAARLSTSLLNPGVDCGCRVDFCERVGRRSAKALEFVVLQVVLAILCFGYRLHL